MVYAVYIAAAAVIGLLIGFVALSVLWLKKTVLKNIRSKTLELISVYDVLLEEKSRRLKELDRQEITEVSGHEETNNEVNADLPKGSDRAGLCASELLGMTERSGGAIYRERMLGELYSKIRSNFSFNTDEIISQLSEKKTSEKESPANKILRELNPDTVYRLSELEPEAQVTILREAFGEENAELIDNYLKKHAVFNALDFYDYLLFLAAVKNNSIKLSVPKGAIPERTEYGDVTVIPDDEICEGFLLEENNILYDYCIKARELG